MQRERHGLFWWWRSGARDGLRVRRRGERQAAEHNESTADGREHGFGSHDRGIEGNHAQVGAQSRDEKQLKQYFGYRERQLEQG